MTLRGKDELERKLNKLSGGVSDALEAAAHSGALLIVNDAKTLAPYKTGTLRRSIHPQTHKKTKTAVTVRVGTNVVYAHNQEFGTTVPAHPYLRPAIDQNRGKVLKEIKEALGDIIRSVK